MVKSKISIALALTLTLGVQGCTDKTQDKAEATPKVDEASTELMAKSSQSDIAINPTNDVYFGNFHIHTSYSFDGFTNGSVTNPDDAYRWAKGEAIPGGGTGGDIQIKRPLDWYVVSDHAEYMGVFKQMSNPANPISQLPIAKRITSKDQAVAFKAYSEVNDGMNAGISDPQLTDPKVTKPIWAEVVATTESHNEPGKFTTFPGYEWTSAPDDRNLHRVVVFKNATAIPELPFSTIDSNKPEELWAWMDKQRANGATLFAIPHNGNASDGIMFPENKSFGGSEMNTAYSDARMRNEPLYEMTQIKGNSETHPDLSPNDEFSAFEIWDYTLSPSAVRPTNRVGSYIRDALLRGMKQEAEGKGNPFKYGLIGDSDSHNSASSMEEDNYTGKFGMENDANHRLNGLPGFPEANNVQVREFGSAGLAAIWAKSNTREDLYAAMLRKETYATTGTRIKVRTFASFNYSMGMLEKANWLESAYSDGVPMGGDLSAANLQGAQSTAPILVIQALKDADGANLDRIQVIKGWVKDGQTFEKIYNVALADDRKVDSNGKVTAVGNTVDAKTATYKNTIGDAALSTVWKDPDFDSKVHAFYYVRVLEIPTPRWSTYDAATLGQVPRTDIPVSIQERAYSSPIWYTP